MLLRDLGRVQRKVKTLFFFSHLARAREKHFFLTGGGSSAVTIGWTDYGGLSPNFTEWDENDVGVWLEMRLGLKEYVGVFKENHVTG